MAFQAKSFYNNSWIDWSVYVLTCKLCEHMWTLMHTSHLGDPWVGALAVDTVVL